MPKTPSSGRSAATPDVVKKTRDDAEISKNVELMPSFFSFPILAKMSELIDATVAERPAKRARGKGLNPERTSPAPKEKRAPLIACE